MGYSQENGTFGFTVLEDFTDKHVEDIFERNKSGCRDISKKSVRVINLGER